MIEAIIQLAPAYRQAQPVSGPQVNSEQIGFDFPTLADSVAAGSPKKAVRAKRGTSAAVMGPEACAQVLEQHSDFRVQRRLQPVVTWPGTSGAATRRVVVLDTETTGLDQAKEAIIELAMLCVDVDVMSGVPVGVVDIYDGLEDPGRPIPKEAQVITGISDADVAGKRLDVERITALLDGADLVIAHNAGFDRPFVERRLPIFADFPWACSFADIDWKEQGLSSAKLESLAQFHGWFYDAHRAEMDCHALLAVLAKPLPTAPQTGLQRLISAATTPVYRLSANQAPFEAKDKLKARAYRWNAEAKVWQTRLNDTIGLDAECEWLKAHVYPHRIAAVQVEKFDAMTKYSSRSGEVIQRTL